MIQETVSESQRCDKVLKAVSKILFENEATRLTFFARLGSLWRLVRNKGSFAGGLPEAGQDVVYSHHLSLHQRAHRGQAVLTHNITRMFWNTRKNKNNEKTHKNFQKHFLTGQLVYDDQNHSFKTERQRDKHLDVTCLPNSSMTKALCFLRLLSSFEKAELKHF